LSRVFKTVEDNLSNLLFRVTIILFTFIVAINAKNIDMIISINGSIFANSLVYIIPPLLYLK
jgi:amino acid permease